MPRRRGSAHRLPTRRRPVASLSADCEARSSQFGVAGLAVTDDGVAAAISDCDEIRECGRRLNVRVEILIDVYGLAFADSTKRQPFALPRSINTMPPC